MDQLSSTARKLDVFFKIINIVCTVFVVALAVGLCLIGAVFVFGLAPEQIGTGYNSLELGMLELTLAEGIGPDPRQVLLITSLGIVMAGVGVVLAKYSVKLIRQILAPMTKGEPFHATVSTNLKKMSILVLIVGVANSLVSSLTNALLLKNYDLSGLLISEKITAVSVNTTIDLTFLAVAAVLLLLSYVFRYGQELQKLSDETL